LPKIPIFTKYQCKNYRGVCKMGTGYLQNPTDGEQDSVEYDCKKKSADGQNYKKKKNKVLKCDVTKI